jgi:malonate-semialdehyde dehydrogenase (acetylating)/methylmalonate-semialdehyde dehydrogenase
MAMMKIRNYMNGEWVESKSKKVIDVMNPATDEALAKVPLSTKEETEKAIGYANDAFWGWRCKPPLERARLLMKLKSLLEKEQSEIAKTLTLEHGKTYNEAHLEIERAIENVEVSTGVTSMMMGHLLEDVAPGIDEYDVRQPLGVFASLNPFNFPAMIPFWSLPYAVACGNTVVVKSSSRVPMTMEKIFGLIHEAGFPKGVINLVNGSSEVADTLMESPSVKGISFVGSTTVGRHVYKKSAENFKRVQVQAGAKNFGIVMPDAKLDKVVPNIAASAFDCSGQRCLALAVILAVGDIYKEVQVKVQESAQRYKVGFGLDKGVTMGPVVSKEAKGKIEGYITKGIEEGAKLILDGRGYRVDGYPNGYWVGPTIFSECQREMAIVNEEIFGPVLCIMKIKDLNEGIDIINASRYANAATLYTQNGAAAREFKYHARCGNLGINIGVAAPMAFFHFGGSKDSFYGDLHAQGRDAFQFFTDAVVVVERWY